MGAAILRGNKVEVSKLGFPASLPSSEENPLPGEERSSLEEGPSGCRRVFGGRSIPPEEESEEGLGESLIPSSPKRDQPPPPAKEGGLWGRSL